jgi:hypothetical protein
MKTKKALYISGFVIILLGICMFWFGVYMFTYQGSGHSNAFMEIESKIGMYSFFLWMPTIITGIILVVIAANTKND